MSEQPPPVVSEPLIWSILKNGAWPKEKLAKNRKRIERVFFIKIFFSFYILTLDDCLDINKDEEQEFRT
jgi:hypothetical protein